MLNLYVWLILALIFSWCLVCRYPVASFSTSKFNYGIRDDYIRKLTEYWKNEYSWKKQEQMMNKYSHYKTMIEGLNIHFIHCRPKKVQEEVG